MVHLRSVMWPVMGRLHQQQCEERDANFDMLFARAEAGSIRPDSREVDVIASTETLDSHGTVMRQNWDLDRFKANPVVLWAHDRQAVPIGTASRVKVAGNKKEGRRLEATLRLRDAEKSPKAEEVWQGLQDGTIKGVSVGFRSHSRKWEKQDDLEFLVLDQNELLEISLCAVPSNPDTLATLRARMLEERSHNDSAPDAGGSSTKPNVEESEMTDTKTLARAAGLPEDATEAQLVERMTALQSDRTRLLGALEVESVDAAVEAIEAGRKAIAGATELAGRVAELEKAAEDTERAALVEKLQQSGRSVPAQEKFLASLSVEQLREHEKTAPTLPLKSAHKEPGSSGSSGSSGYEAREQHNGKTLERMSGNEQVALKKADPEAFERLVNDWIKAGRPARDLEQG